MRYAFWLVSYLSDWATGLALLKLARILRWTSEQLVSAAFALADAQGVI